MNYYYIINLNKKIILRFIFYICSEVEIMENTNTLNELKSFLRSCSTMKTPNMTMAHFSKIYELTTKLNPEQKQEAAQFAEKLVQSSDKKIALKSLFSFLLNKV